MIRRSFYFELVLNGIVWVDTNFSILLRKRLRPVFGRLLQLYDFRILPTQQIVGKLSWFV